VPTSKPVGRSELQEIRRLLLKLSNAAQSGRSLRWCLRLWSRYIRERDAHSCVVCKSPNGIQAHHLFRRSLYPNGQLQPGNGITLCIECHKMPHAAFNGRPDMSLPIGTQGGDDQDEIATYYGILLEDANTRNLDHNEFYYLSDEMLQFFVRVQGYADVYLAVQGGQITRLEMAYGIWRQSPEIVRRKLIESLFAA